MRRSRFRAIAVAAILAVLIATAASAAPGDADPTFSDDGLTIADFGAVEQRFGGVARDGSRIVAAGRADGDVAVARFRKGGGPDDTFGGDGTVRIDVGRDGEIVAVVAHPDGKLSLVGWIEPTSGPDRVLVVRLKPDGRRDRKFGDRGVALARAPGGAHGLGYDALLQADGKLVVVGEATDGGSKASMAAFRFRRDGRLDATFGGDGRVTVDIGPSLDGAWRVAPMSGGKLLLAGWSARAGRFRTALVRLLANGQPDDTFSGDGERLVDALPGGTNRAVGLAVVSSGIVVGIAANTDTFYDARVAKLRPNGTLDPSFGDGDGLAEGFGPGFELADIAVRSDGRIVGVGQDEDLVSFLLRPNGAFVGDYGVEGIADSMLQGNRFPRMTVDGTDRPVVIGDSSGFPAVYRIQG